MRRGSPVTGEPRYRPAVSERGSATRGAGRRGGSLPATAAGTAAESAATIAAFAVLIARALRALTLLVAVAVLLAHRTDREIHAALTVDLGDLHLHGVADVHDVLNAIDPFGRELRNAHQDFLAGQVLDERAAAHDPRDLAVVDLADLRLLGHSHDHRLGPLAAVCLRAGNADRSVVLELDRGARLRLDRADHLAAGADDLADLVGVDLDRRDARCELRELAARTIDDLFHRVEDEEARFPGLHECLAHDLQRDALDLDVHLQGRDALRGAADLEVHVTVVVLETLDVGEHGVLPVRGDKSHRDAGDHLADRNAGVHERERRTARGRHRRRAVRLERFAHDADRVRELLLRWKDGRDRSLRERAVADLAPARAAHHAHLADRIRGEVVVVHVALGVDGRERVDDLLVAGRTERGDGQHLCLSTREEPGAMRAWQDAHFDRQGADGLRVAAVRSEVLLGDRAAEFLLEDLLVDRGHLVGRDGRAFRRESDDSLVLQLFETCLALCLVRIAELRAQALLEERDDRGELVRVGPDRGEDHLRLTRLAPQILLRVADRLDTLLREREGLDERVLGHLVRTGLDHHHRVARPRDDEVEIALLELLDRRIERELAVDGPDADAADRTLKWCVRDVQRGRRGVHREDVVLILLVGRPRRNDDLDIVLEALRPQRPDRAVDKARGEDAFLRGTALAPRERAGDLARGVEALLEVDGEREEVDAEPRGLRDGRRREHDGVAVLDGDRAAGLLRELAGLEP